MGDKSPKNKAKDQKKKTDDKKKAAQVAETERASKSAGAAKGKK